MPVVRVRSARPPVNGCRPSRVPEYVSAVPPPDPGSLRGRAGDGVTGLFQPLATICLVIGSVVIGSVGIGSVDVADTTLVAVLEHTGGGRSTPVAGARARHSTVRSPVESGVPGMLGGLVGAFPGVAPVVAVAVARDRTPVIHSVTRSRRPRPSARPPAAARPGAPPASSGGGTAPPSAEVYAAALSGRCPSRGAAAALGGPAAAAA